MDHQERKNYRVYNDTQKRKKINIHTIGLQSKQTKYEVLYFQLAFDFNLTVEKAEDTRVGAGIGRDDQLKQHTTGSSSQPLWTECKCFAKRSPSILGLSHVQETTWRATSVVDKVEDAL